MKQTKKNKIHEKINELKSLINEWNYEYYYLNQSSVSDSIFDKTLNELKELEQENPSLLTADSPTQKIYSTLNEKFKKQKHFFKSMLSLENAYSIDELNDFFLRVKKKLVQENIFAQDLEFFFEPKIDGVALSLLYENGFLVSALTRGDGEYGENVFHNVIKISSIPKKIKEKQKINIRGEIYMTYSEFNKLNLDREVQQLEKFSNPRNIASGTIRQLDFSTKERQLDFIAYFCYFENQELEEQYNTHSLRMKILEENNFKTSSLSKLLQNQDDLIVEINNLEKIRNQLDFGVDGAVIKVNKINFQKLIGETKKFPRWAIAYKYKTEIGITILENIVQTIGRTGLVTYNAILKPIKILDTIVSKATLHNKEYIKSLDLRIGDYVNVKKAGEIIPKVLSSIVEKRSESLQKWIPNEKCFFCKEKLIEINNIDQYCKNKNCSEIKLQKLIFYASKNALNIEFLGKTIIKKFFSLELIKTIEDIYKLHKKKDLILSIQGFKQKLVDKILKSIELSKKQPLRKLIFALGINDIGEKVSSDLEKAFNSLEEIMNAKISDFQNIPDFGEIRSNSIFDWVNNDDNKQLIKNLKEFDLNFNSSRIIIEKTKFWGKNIAITGSLEDKTRDELKEFFFSLGANFKMTVSAKTDFLIVGNSPSNNKLKKIDSSKIIYCKNFFELKKYF